MKTKSIIILLLLTGTQLSFSQGFLNLNFNSANIPNGATSGSMIPASDAIPDWTLFLGATQQSSVLYNDLTLGTAAIAILDTNSPVPGLIPGNDYTVVLQAGAGSSGNVSASIVQTGMIPANAETILFEASLSYGAGWQVTINGQNIPVSEISTINADDGIFAGNISSFAGQTDPLEFTALAGSGPMVNLYLDSISFSTSPVPEPTTLTLSVIGGLFLTWRRWKKSQ